MPDRGLLEPIGKWGGAEPRQTLGLPALSRPKAVGRGLPQEHKNRGPGLHAGLRPGRGAYNNSRLAPSTRDAIADPSPALATLEEAERGRAVQRGPSDGQRRKTVL